MLPPTTLDVCARESTILLLPTLLLRGGLIVLHGTCSRYYTLSGDHTVCALYMDFQANFRNDEMI